MLTMPKPLEFEWDQGNINKNFQKHGITNQEAEQIFTNQPNLILPDPTHSHTEARYLLLGPTNRRTLLSIVFTIRNHKIRIISARPMSRRQRSFYATKTKTDS